MGTNNRNKKTDELARMQVVKKALAVHFKKKLLPLAGQTVKADDAIAQLDAQIARMEAAESARAGWRLAVRDQNSNAPALRGLVLRIQRYLSATLGEASAVYADFGFAPKKTPKRTAEGKAQAVVKLRATREARHTMGTRQRRSIKGTLAAHAPNASLVVAAPSGVTMTASTAGANGVTHANGAT